MSYTPVIPLSGYSGWVMLNKTMERQQAAFNASGQNQRTADYFREKIGDINSAEDLVNDRRLLSVALGAFGLESEINNKYFIRKVLDEGTLDEKSFANKLADKTYLRLSEAFGFGDYETPLSKAKGFADKILAQYTERQFEAAVGNVNQSYRIALTAQRDLASLAEASSTDNTKWYTVIGSKSMSSFVRTALGLPSAVSSLDVDQQLAIYKSKASRMFGSRDFASMFEGDGLDKMTKNYVVRAQLVDGVTSVTPKSGALRILQTSSAMNSSGNILSLLL